MKLINLCKKYGLSDMAYVQLCLDVQESKRGMYFTVMRHWIKRDYFIVKDSLDVREVQ